MSPTSLVTDMKKLLAPSAAQPEIVDVPDLAFLMIDGTGDPVTSKAYADAIGALYSLSYGAKFALKKTGLEFRVMPLEGLWWSDDPEAFLLGKRADWQWTAMIMQPDAVTAEIVEKVRAEAMSKKPQPALSKVRFARFHEGLAAQVMHIGPYSAEGPTIKRLHDFIAERGHRLKGKHHEIYLGDPRRAAPDKLKTIVRQPISSATSHANRLGA
jgi:hypothetical protein